MPWTDDRYPPSMRRLPAPTRHKAIAKAKAWAEVHLDLPTSAALPDGELPARPRSWHSP